MGGKEEEMKKYKLVVTEQSWGCKVQYRKWSSQRTYMYDPWTWTMVWELPEGVAEGVLSGGRQRGNNWTTVIA